MSLDDKTKRKFAKFIVGQAGSGKSTYCRELQKIIKLRDRRAFFINLDIFSQNKIYKSDISILDIISSENSSKILKMGFNPFSIIQLIEILNSKFHILLERFDSIVNKERKKSDLLPVYYIFDFPGSNELFLQSMVTHKFIKKFKRAGYSLIAINMVDSISCSRRDFYIISSFNCLNLMGYLDIPCINVLSKIDLLKIYGNSKINIETFLNCNIEDLLKNTKPDKTRFHNYIYSLIGVLKKFNKIRYHPISITQSDSLKRLLDLSDKISDEFYPI